MAPAGGAAGGAGGHRGAPGRSGGRRHARHHSLGLPPHGLLPVRPQARSSCVHWSMTPQTHSTLFAPSSGRTGSASTSSAGGAAARQHDAPSRSTKCTNCGAGEGGGGAGGAGAPSAVTNFLHIQYLKQRALKLAQGEGGGGAGGAGGGGGAGQRQGPWRRRARAGPRLPRPQGGAHPAGSSCFTIQSARREWPQLQHAEVTRAKHGACSAQK